jgi:2-phospho-L-lactate guanylyltransferase
MRRIWALIPVKDFVQSKSRLASALSAADRRSLAIAMTRDVASALTESKSIERVIVVSDIPGLDQLLGIDGVGHFNTEQACGLNEDLASAIDWVGGQGATHVLVAHADLPLLTAAAVDRFIASETDTTSLVRAAACRKGSGTNVLLAPVPLPLPLVFGKNSLTRFRRLAAEAGISLEVVHNSSLATDIDEPDDFCELISALDRGKVAGPATGTFVMLTGLSARSGALSQGKNP